MTCKHYDKEFMCCKLYSDWSMGMPEFASCTIPCKDYSTFTNYDRIRNMSIGELAEFIYELLTICDETDNCEDCKYNNNGACVSKNCVRLWLESEVQENA